MHGIDFIQDLAVILLVAGVVGWICSRIGLSVVAGYLVAGILVGPYTPPFTLVTDTARIETLAQIGLVFLMFSIGLRLSLRKLRRLGFSLLIGVCCSAAIIYYLTRLLGVAMGWSSRACLFLAAMLMVSSSAIISKVLQETGRTHERVGQLAMGVTVLEDVVAVVMLTLLNSVVQFGAAKPAIGETLGMFGAFVVLAGVAGLLLVPALLRRLSVHAAEELQTIGIAALLFGLPLIAQRAGYSLALGAFLLGTIVAETPHRTQVERTFEGMRDVFTAVFFVAIGMQLDVGLLRDSAWLIAGLAVFTICARTFAATVGLSLIGTPVRDSFRVGMAITPVGEFSFIIAQLGIMAGLPRSYYATAVGISLLTTLVAPALARNSDRISSAVFARRPGIFQAWHAHYFGWLESLNARQKRNLVWQLSRKRFAQIGVEMLFVTGLLVFSEPLRDFAEGLLGPDWLFPGGLTVIFWSALALIVLAPIVAIWRNISALCLLFAQVITTGNARAPQLARIVESVFKLVAGAALYVWLATVTPMPGHARWLLFASAVVAILLLFLFKRKLVLWHSELEIGLQDVFKGPAPGGIDTTAPWLGSHGDWELHVTECVLPDLANCQGKRIAELDLRARFGCAAVGIGRQGYLISLPSPEEVLYPRDHVLLLGTTEQIEAGKRFLSAVSATPPAGGEFEDVRMESMTVPPQSPAVGKDLKTLSPARSHRVQIAGIHRGGARILNPAGHELVLAGDELLVIGSPDQIRGFRDWLVEQPGEAK
ncbi:sodium:proton exchanger [Opitutaceae bacterium EW11]|nr:sodium:proton exchanger [Opitutaceae bacterium EW11]